MPNSINKIIKTLIAADFFLNWGWGLVVPIFAIFVVENITVGSAAEGAKVAGFAYFFYWGAKSIFQVPIGNHLDRIRGEKDDFWFMVIGTFITGVVPFGFLASSLPWHIYFWEIVQALGMAMVIPSWNAVFSRHIDKGREGIEWAMDSSFLGFGAGLGGALGGILVSIFGFKIVFAIVGTLTIISGFALLFAHKDVHPSDGFFPNYYPSLPKIRLSKIFRFPSFPLESPIDKQKPGQESDKNNNKNNEKSRNRKNTS